LIILSHFMIIRVQKWYRSIYRGGKIGKFFSVFALFKFCGEWSRSGFN